LEASCNCSGEISKSRGLYPAALHQAASQLTLREPHSLLHSSGSRNSFTSRSTAVAEPAAARFPGGCGIGKIPSRDQGTNLVGKIAAGSPGRGRFRRAHLRRRLPVWVWQHRPRHPPQRHEGAAQGPNGEEFHRPPWRFRRSAASRIFAPPQAASGRMICRQAARGKRAKRQPPHRHGGNGPIRLRMIASPRSLPRSAAATSGPMANNQRTRDIEESQSPFQ